MNESLARFPFPFEDDVFAYTANLEPAGTVRRTAAGAWGESVLDVDEHYAAELAARAAILAADPGRCAVAAHMGPAAWDALLTVLALLAEARPTSCALEQTAPGEWLWRNGLLGIERRFTEGDDASLPEGPLWFAGSQVQEDLVLLDERDGSLHVDAGLVTFASNWSIAFDAGMSFLDVHGPIPRDYGEGAIVRAEAFLRRLQPGPGYRRVNWSSTAGHRLDTSLETYDRWGRERVDVLAGDLARDLFLRVEVQHLIRLPVSHAILFTIRTYLRPFGEVATVPAWRERMISVIETLADDIAEYKGFTRYRAPLLAALRAAPGV